MNAGEHGSAQHGEDGHGFGGAVDGGAPLLAEEQQDRRDERAGVADTDPEDEVRNIEGPAHAVVESPNADAFGDEPGDHSAQVQQGGEGDAEADPPAFAGLAFKRARDIVGDVVERRIPIDPSWWRKYLGLGPADGCWSRCKSDGAHETP